MQCGRGVSRAVLAALITLLGASACSAGSGEDAGATTPTEAPNAAVAAADARVAEWVGTERIPGAVLLVARNGEVVFEEAYGQAWMYAHAEGEYGASAAGEDRPGALRRLDDAAIAMTTDTVFDLASVTKVMATTFATMLLADDGDLELDAPVRRYLPDFGRGPAGTSQEAPGKGDITIRQLLTHRSGLSQWQPLYYSAGNGGEAYGLIRDFPLAWEPGAGRHYSDLGFMLLGVIVERISGRPLDVFLQERLYGPLGLSTTGFRRRGESGPPVSGGAIPQADAAGPAVAATSHGNPFEHRMVHDPDFGYRIDLDPDSWDGWRRYTLVGEVNDGNAFHAFGGVAGHAGLFSDAVDLQVLLQLLLNGGGYGGRRYISAAVIDEFMADTGDGQRLGWWAPDYLPAGSFAHTGFTGTFVAGIPSQGLAIVLLTNRQNVGLDDEGNYPNIGELQRGVARVLLSR